MMMMACRLTLWGYWLVLLVLLSPLKSCGSSAAPWTHPYLRLRSLLQRPTPAGPSRTARVPDVPQCMWNEVREICLPSQLVYLAIQAKPVTIIHRAAAQAYDRNLVCTGHANEQDCNRDTANRCMYWSKSCVGADAFELVKWGGGDNLDGQATLAAFTCQGTEAARYKTCKSATEAGADGICNQLPGCQWVNLTSDCLPVSWDSKTFKQVQELRKGFDTYSVSVWGQCAGACYARQAQICQNNYNDTVACTKRPYCVWMYDASDKRKVCQHRDSAAAGTDAYSKAFYQMKTTCNKATTQDECEAPRIVPGNQGLYRATRDLQRISQEQAVRCLL